MMIESTPGAYPVALKVSNILGVDSIIIPAYINIGGMRLPLNETFENNSATRNLWTIQNPNGDSTWRLWTVAGTSPGNLAMGINNYDAPLLYYQDVLLSPVLDLRGLQNANLSFSHAYTRLSTSSSDSLIVSISTNCG